MVLNKVNGTTSDWCVPLTLVLLFTGLDQHIFDLHMFNNGKGPQGNCHDEYGHWNKCSNEPQIEC